MTRTSYSSDAGGRPPVDSREDPPGTPLIEVRLSQERAGDPVSEMVRSAGGEPHLIACRMTDRAPRRLLRWLDVEIEPGRAEGLLLALQSRIRPRYLAFARLGPRRLLLRVSEPAPPTCRAVYRAGGLCVTCPLQAREGRSEWRLVLPRDARAKALLREPPHGSGRPPAIGRLKPYRSKTNFTPRQDQALRVAFDLGYFSYPRGASLADVARLLGTSRSTALELLRHATAKLAGRRYGDELQVRRTP